MKMSDCFRACSTPLSENLLHFHTLHFLWRGKKKTKTFATQSQTSVWPRHNLPFFFPPFFFSLSATERFKRCELRHLPPANRSLRWFSAAVSLLLWPQTLQRALKRRRGPARWGLDFSCFICADQLFRKDFNAFIHTCTAMKAAADGPSVLVVGVKNNLVIKHVIYCHFKKNNRFLTSVVGLFIHFASDSSSKVIIFLNTFLS